jgi:hypothetical protein
MTWTTLWLSLTALVVIAEVAAIIANPRHGTLSAQVQALYRHPLARIPILALWAWLTWHWFAEPRDLVPVVWDDIALVLLGALLAGFSLLINRPAREAFHGRYGDRLNNG